MSKSNFYPMTSGRLTKRRLLAMPHGGWKPSLAQQPLPLALWKDSIHKGMTGLTRGSVCGWCRICLVEKGKHTLILEAWHGSPPDDSPKSYMSMQQNKYANLSWFPIGQYKTTLSASGVTNDHCFSTCSNLESHALVPKTVHTTHDQR